MHEWLIAHTSNTKSPRLYVAITTAYSLAVSLPVVYQLLDLHLTCCGCFQAVFVH